MRLLVSEQSLLCFSRIPLVSYINPCTCVTFLVRNPAMVYFISNSATFLGLPVVDNNGRPKYLEYYLHGDEHRYNVFFCSAECFRV